MGRGFGKYSTAFNVVLKRNFFSRGDFFWEFGVPLTKIVIKISGPMWSFTVKENTIDSQRLFANLIFYRMVDFIDFLTLV